MLKGEKKKGEESQSFFQTHFQELWQLRLHTIDKRLMILPGDIEYSKNLKIQSLVQDLRS